MRLLLPVLALLAAPSLAAAQVYVPGEIVVKLRPGVGRTAARTLHDAEGTRVLETIEELGVQRLALPAGRAVDDMVARYRADPRCEFAERNYVGSGGFVPSDTSFGSQWHLNNTGQTGGTADADTDAVEAWDLARGHPGVTVAVLDTGIEAAHPEFQGRLLPGYDFVNEDADPEADHPHGVQVSGILAANADNSFAVAGVDHGAKILPIKVLNQNNAGTVFDLAQGLTFAANQSADVANLSLINYPLTTLLNDALQYARDAGVILIACAGNNGLGDADVSGPGVSPLTLSVGWTDDDDVRSVFSATGSALDLVAPGLLIETVAAGTAVDSTSSFSGCSASTPIVAGAASLLVSLVPWITHDGVRVILTGTADDQVGPPGEDTPGRDDFFGHGRLNLRAALAAAPTAVPVASWPARGLVAALLLAGGLGAARRQRP